MTKADVQEIDKNSLTKCTTTLQSQIVKAVDSTSKYKLQASYFTSNNGSKNDMFKVVEQALAKQSDLDLPLQSLRPKFEARSRPNL